MAIFGILVVLSKIKVNIIDHYDTSPNGFYGKVHLGLVDLVVERVDMSKMSPKNRFFSRFSVWEKSKRLGTGLERPESGTTTPRLP